MPNQHICPICGKGKGGADHRACSKALQAQHLAHKKKPAPRKLATCNINYLSGSHHDL